MRSWVGFELGEAVHGVVTVVDQDDVGDRAIVICFS